MDIDDSAYRRLEEAARRDGHLHLDDLARILPLDTMSMTEVTDVVERLERSGIDVDLSPLLARLRRDAEAGNSDGVVDLASPAAPAISSPRMHPTTQADIVAMGETHHHGHHGRKRAPIWNVNGVEMLPMMAIGIAAVVLIVALG